MRRSLLAGVATGALLSFGPVNAEVATDGTMGARTRLIGRDVSIGHGLGTIKGKNLFHSFARFDIETNGSATFTGPAGLDRVISRVTGGNASSIDGTLRSTVPGADIYLINPAGILFGPNARLDVPASFHATTADELKFPDGGVFSARRPERTVLSVAAPEAFGFLGARPGKIVLNQGRLEVGAGKSLSLVGGDVAVIGTGVAEEGGIVRAPGGQLTLASLGRKGAVPVDNDNLFFDPGAEPAFTRGNMLLGAAAAIDTTGDGGGKLRVRSGRLLLATGATITARNSGGTNATDGITVRARKLAIGTGSSIAADTSAMGAAGTLIVSADSLSIASEDQRFFTGITSNANPGSSGSAGSLGLVVKGRLEVHGGAQISSSTFGTGDAGPLAVVAGRLTIDGSTAPGFFTGIASNSTAGAGGSAGDVAVAVGGRLEIRGAGSIVSDTSTGGNAGSVSIRAGSLTIDGSAAPGSFTGISSDSVSPLAGGAGAVSVTVDRRLEILGGGISSSTFGSGNGGQVSVHAGNLAIDSHGSLFFTGIASNAEAGSTGNAGAVRVTVSGDLALSSGGAISSSTFAGGNAGLVTVEARNLAIDRSGAVLFTGIASQASAESTGSAGALLIMTKGELSIIRGGEISTNAFASGDGGLVTIQADRLRIDGGGASALATGITSEASLGSTGAGGAVIINVDGLLELQNGQIQSSNFGTGLAGGLLIGAGRLDADSSFILSNSVNDLGGQLLVTSRSRLTLVDSTISTSGSVPREEASVILLTAPTVVLLAGSRVTALTGDGKPLEGSGVVAILSRRTLISEDSRVKASSQVGILGAVNSLRTPDSLSAETPTDPSRLLRDCAEERLGGRGSFKATGKGGLPASPEEFLSGRPVEGGGKSVRTANAGC